MIELSLHSDRTYTIRVSAETPAKLNKDLTYVKELNKRLVRAFESKVGIHNGPVANGPKMKNVEQKKLPFSAPLCPIHGKPLVRRYGRFGEFLACDTRSPDGAWCKTRKKLENFEPKEVL